MPTQGAMLHAVGPAGQTITVPSEAMLQTVNKILSGSAPSTPTNVTMPTGASPTTTTATGQQIPSAAPVGKGTGTNSGTETVTELEDKKQ